MSLRSLSNASFTPTATADAANLADGTHLSIQGSTSTERIVIQEVFAQGQAPATSSPTNLVLARHSTVGATLSLATGAKDAAQDASSPAGTARGYNTATTKPQRSATLGLLVCGLNAFGGNFRWQHSGISGKEISLVGNAASLGEMGLSAFTGGTVGAIGAHIIYEPM
jgi:hypothetical protein